MSEFGDDASYANLGAYMAEIRAQEDAWLKDEADVWRTGGKGHVIGTSRWNHCRNKLNEIDGRHGIKLDDPRVYSILGHKQQKREIEGDWERLCGRNGWDKRPDPANVVELQRFWIAENHYFVHLDNLDARIFGELTSGCESKSARHLWGYINKIAIPLLESVKGSGGQLVECRNSADKFDVVVEAVMSALHKLQIPWADEPPYSELPLQESIDKLRSVANRLEVDERRRLPLNGSQPTVARDLRIEEQMKDELPSRIWTVQDYYQAKEFYEKRNLVFNPALELGSPAEYHVRAQIKLRASAAAKTDHATSSPNVSVSEMIKVLLLSANPIDSTLSIDEEFRAVDQKIRSSEHRDHVNLIKHGAVRLEDVPGLLMRYKPDVVHFSGHGATSGIALTGADGKGRLVPPDALANIFRTLKDNIRVVVLNACHSAAQAEAIVSEIDCAVGMSDRIADNAAIAFAAAFYEALGYGQSVQNAFDLALVQLEGAGADRLLAKLYQRQMVKPSDIVLVNPLRPR